MTRLALRRNPWMWRDGYNVRIDSGRTLVGEVNAVVCGDGAAFEVLPAEAQIRASDFNPDGLPLTGYTSLRAAILALAHACGYPDAELPEGWTP